MKNKRLYKWLWSKFYDGIMKDAEDKGLRDWRSSLLKNISGEVLELGCGTGANLEFYSDSIKRLVLINVLLMDATLHVVRKKLLLRHGLR